jgi:hypothetical protein
MFSSPACCPIGSACPVGPSRSPATAQSRLAEQVARSFNRRDPQVDPIELYPQAEQVQVERPQYQGEDLARR